MKFERSSGILLHPTSLPGPYGIGDIGPMAFRFVDWLASTGSKLWQVLPLGPTGYGDSPYQCFSAFAGNPYLISPELLIKDGLLTHDDLAGMPAFDASKVDFGSFIPWKLDLLLKAFKRFVTLPKGNRDDVSDSEESLIKEFKVFCKENSSWLDDFALFMSLKEANGGGAWKDWEKSIRTRKLIHWRKNKN